MWTRDANGDLLNLGRCVSMYVDRERELVALLRGEIEPVSLLCGTASACEQAMKSLMADSVKAAGPLWIETTDNGVFNVESFGRINLRMLASERWAVEGWDGGESVLLVVGDRRHGHDMMERIRVELAVRSVWRDTKAWQGVVRPAHVTAK